MIISAAGASVACAEQIGLAGEAVPNIYSGFHQSWLTIESRRA